MYQDGVDVSIYGVRSAVQRSRAAEGTVRTAAASNPLPSFVGNNQYVQRDLSGRSVDGGGEGADGVMYADMGGEANGGGSEVLYTEVEKRQNNGFDDDDDGVMYADMGDVDSSAGTAGEVLYTTVADTGKGGGNDGVYADMGTDNKRASNDGVLYSEVELDC